MVRKAILLVFALCGLAKADAGFPNTINVTETDNSPKCQAGQLKFSPGSLSCSGSVATISGGSGSGGGTAGSGFNYRRTITIDHTKVPNTNQTNFPVLFSYTSTFLSTTTHVLNSSGYDIIFSTMSDCSFRLKWDTETYNASTGNMLTWVKLPSVSTSVDTLFYMCYGKSSITTYQGVSTGTWDTNTLAEYHLGSNASLGLKDSTSFGLTLTNTNATAATGQVGTAASLDGSTAYLQGGAVTDLNLTSSGTISAWIFSAGGAREQIVGKDNFGTDRNGYTFYLNPGTSKLGVELANASTFQQANSNTSLVGNGVWHHVALTWDSATINMYVDGANDLSTAQTVVPLSNVFVMSIGRRGDAASDLFSGTIDETRIENTARSADWIKTSYNNQSSPSTFYSVGPEEIGAGIPAYLDQVQTWTAAQTFNGQTIITSTSPANQVFFASASGKIVTNSSFTFGEAPGGAALNEVVQLKGSNPGTIYRSQAASGVQFFYSTATANGDLQGAIIMHPNNFPVVAQGNLNVYDREGGNIQLDVTGEAGNTRGTIQFRYAAPAEEGLPMVAGQFDSTGTFLVDGLRESVDGMAGDRFITKSTATQMEVRVPSTRSYAVTFSTQSSASLNYTVGVSSRGYLVINGAPPVPSACGTSPVMGTGSNMQQGSVSWTGAATGCTLTWALPWGSLVGCLPTDNSTLSVPTTTSLSNTAVTFGLSAALTGGTLYYYCFGNQ